MYLETTQKSIQAQDTFSSPFIEERLYLLSTQNLIKITTVLVPFYRGAVVFRLQEEHKRHTASSRPLLSRSGCIFKTAEEVNEWLEKFSSPFIEERLYFSRKK